MREIKFRVWDGTKMKSLSIALWEDLVGVQHRKENSFELEAFYEGVVIEQFTGLTDMYGNEIFEGDILDFTTFDYNDIDTQWRGIVKFSNGGWKIWNSEKDEHYECDGAFDLDWVWHQDDELEIIGDIHNNPELLEVKNEH